MGLSPLSGLRVFLLVLSLVYAVPLTAQTQWESPPTKPVDPKRAGPRLVNYAHRNDLELGPNAKQREDKLAQWDVLILNPDHDLSLEKIRETNPQIKILLWIPLQGPGNYSFSKGFQEKWWARDKDGQRIRAPWNEFVANPYADNFGYPRHLLRYLADKIGSYDGVLYDCVSEANWLDCDINGDGLLDEKDTDRKRQAVIFLLSETRREFPAWIITANGGPAWSIGGSYWKLVNGNMFENALGNQFADNSWEKFWSSLSEGGVQSLSPKFNLAVADLRRDRTQDQAAQADTLTSDDFRRMRLGLVSSMMVDGTYYGFDRGDCLHGQLWWFKEYSTDLGKPLAAYSWNQFGQGLLSREFEKAILLVNPTDEVQRVNFDEVYKNVSTGVTDRTFALGKQDAAIFLRVE